MQDISELKNERKICRFTRKIVSAVLEMQKGSPLKDFMTDADIEEALSMFADVLITLGVQIGVEE